MKLKRTDFLSKQQLKELYLEDRTAFDAYRRDIEQIRDIASTCNTNMRSSIKWGWLMQCVIAGLGIAHFFDFNAREAMDYVLAFGIGGFFIYGLDTLKDAIDTRNMHEDNHGIALSILRDMNEVAFECGKEAVKDLADNLDSRITAIEASEQLNAEMAKGTGAKVWFDDSRVRDTDTKPNANANKLKGRRVKTGPYTLAELTGISIINFGGPVSLDSIITDCKLKFPNETMSDKKIWSSYLGRVGRKKPFKKIGSGKDAKYDFKSNPVGLAFKRHCDGLYQEWVTMVPRRY